MERVAKPQLRREFIARRRAMKPDEVQRLSTLICRPIIDSPRFRQAPRLFAYLAHRNEVDTTPLIEAALSAGKIVLCPITCGEVLAWGLISSLEKLRRGAFAIREPEQACEVVPQAEDLCIVPGVAYRHDGARLGHGGGHYDRFLANFPGHTIAPAYSWQVTDALEPELHDVPIDYIATEAGLIKTR